MKSPTAMDDGLVLAIMGVAGFELRAGNEIEINMKDRPSTIWEFLVIGHLSTRNMHIHATSHRHRGRYQFQSHHQFAPDSEFISLGFLPL